MKQLNRDPFARSTMFRRNIETNSTCAWCGNHKRTPKGKKYLYQYGLEYDGIHSSINWDKNLFCSIQCMKIYNGGN